MSKPIVFLGNGGHASVLYDVVSKQGTDIVATVSEKTPQSDSLFSQFENYNDDGFRFEFKPNDVELVNGIGFMPFTDIRQRIYQKYKNLGYKFASVIDNSSTVSPSAKLGEGVQLLMGSIVQANAKLGDNSIVNTGVIVEHDCNIGNHCHLAPRSLLCGHVDIQDNVFIGAGSTIKNNLLIAESSVVGMGSKVLRNVAQSEVYFNN
ncbi:acetyltransferase [Catenovulum sp. SM1970]|uniref:acetyltransferase n=1 Tax=Marinifaba aquimaris TaxID=2741323 RepID=UPI001573D488|nr:acetyltransferase [Marinifaba aquimaris]NTS75363.1 acetyltransferase [Marinifaba aquimaris]